MNLSKEEELISNTIAQNLSLDEKTRKFSIHLYNQYKSKMPSKSIENLSTYMSCAVLVAAKSQRISNLKGEELRGVGISFTQIVQNLRSNSDIRSSIISHFLGILKSFINYVNIDEDTQNDLQKILTRFGFLNKMFQKFEDIFKKLKFSSIINKDTNGIEEAKKESETFDDYKKQNDSLEDYKKQARSLAWCLYIVMKKKIRDIDSDIAGNAGILLNIFYVLVMNFPRKFKIEAIEEAFPGFSSSKNREKWVSEVKTYVRTELMSQVPEELFEKFGEKIKPVLKSLCEEIFRFKDTENHEALLFKRKRIQHIIKKLEDYDASHNEKEDLDLDELFFIKEKKAFTPSKITPFTKQYDYTKTATIKSVANLDNFAQPSKRANTSHRILNYDISDGPSMETTLSDTIGTKPLAKIQTPLNTTPRSMRMVQSTPMTSALEMHNWLHEIFKKRDTLNNTKKFENYLKTLSEDVCKEAIKEVQEIIKKVLENTKYTDKENRVEQIFKFFMKMAESIIIDKDLLHREVENRILLSDIKFYQTLACCCIETVFFIWNYSDLNLSKLIKICNIDSFTFWKLIGAFSKSDLTMPGPIHMHLQEIERQIVLDLAWEKDGYMNKIWEEKEKEANGSGGFAYNEEVFFKRVMLHSANLVQNICESLQLIDSIKEDVWKVLKYILSSVPALVFNRTVDLLIFCSIYAVCRSISKVVEFKQIFATYNKNLQRIISDIDMGDGVSKGGICLFYNNIFLKHVKGYIQSLNPQGNRFAQSGGATPLQRRQVFPSLGVNSPLTSSLPQMKIHEHQSPFRSCKMTPLTSMLHAREEFLDTPFSLDSRTPSTRKLEFNTSEKQRSGGDSGSKISGEESARPMNSLLNRLPSKPIANFLKEGSQSGGGIELLRKNSGLGASSLRSPRESSLSNSDTGRFTPTFSEDGETRRTKPKILFGGGELMSRVNPETDRESEPMTEEKIKKEGEGIHQVLEDSKSFALTEDYKMSTEPLLEATIKKFSEEGN